MAGCRDGTSPADQPIMPLDVGTRWTYVMTDSILIGTRPPAPPTRYVVTATATQIVGRVPYTEVENMGLLLDCCPSSFLLPSE